MLSGASKADQEQGGNESALIGERDATGFRKNDGGQVKPDIVPHDSLRRATCWSNHLYTLD